MNNYVSSKARFLIIILLPIVISSCGSKILKRQIGNINVYLVPAQNEGYKHPIMIKPDIVSDCLDKFSEKYSTIFIKNNDVIVNLEPIPFFVFLDTSKKEKLSNEISNALKTCTNKQEVSLEHTNKEIPRCRIFSLKDNTIRFSYIWRLRPREGFWVEFNITNATIVDEAGIGIVIEQFPPSKKTHEVRKKKKKHTIYPIVE